MGLDFNNIGKSINDTVNDIGMQRMYNSGIRMSGFQFDPNNMYNGLSAGPWVEAEDKTPEELNKQRSRGNKILGAIVASFGIIFGILGIINNQMVLSLIGLATFGLGLFLFFTRPNKYDLSNACMINGRQLAKSCNFYQIAYSPTTRRRVRDSDGRVRTETDTNYIHNIFMNPQDDRKWYIIYAYDNEDNNGIYINGRPVNGWRDSKRMILLETQGKQARLLIPDNMSVFVTIANMMGFNYTDNRVKYDSSNAWLIDTFNDMDGNGVEDDKDNSVNNKKEGLSITLGGYNDADSNKQNPFDNGYNTPSYNGYNNQYDMNNNMGYDNRIHNRGIYHHTSFHDNDRDYDDNNNDGNYGNNQNDSYWDNN